MVKGQFVVMKKSTYNTFFTFYGFCMKKFYFYGYIRVQRRFLLDLKNLFEIEKDLLQIKVGLSISNLLG